jgi:tyrosinase
MFDGVLSPVNEAFAPYTKNLAVFTSFIKPTLSNYWNNLSAAQRAQLDARGYKTFADVWNDVTGFTTTIKGGGGISGNEAFAVTCGARYLSRDNPKLDDKTAQGVSEFVVYAGLLPTDFYNSVNILSFTSSKTASHNAPPGGRDSFSTLEGQPHNLVHNCIGGVGAIDPGAYGNMTNFLSPVDPIFFLHHSNMDRLWDVWTRKQKALKLPDLPDGDDLKTLSDEPFLFYVNGSGKYVGTSQAGHYLSTDVFDYDYEPGFGEKIIAPPSPGVAVARAAPMIKGTLKANVASLVVPQAAVRSQVAGAIQRPTMAQITVARPAGTSSAREFDVLVNAPPGVTQVSADSPYYAGTIAFFGPTMPGMNMSNEATFAVPLPGTLHAFAALNATSKATLNIRVVAARGEGGQAAELKGVSVATF